MFTYLVMVELRDYGRPMNPFLIEIPIFQAWADKFWGIWSIFGQFISTHFGTVGSMSMFFINQPLFQQNTKLLALYPNPQKYLRIEFGPERFRSFVMV